MEKFTFKFKFSSHLPDLKLSQEHPNFTASLQMFFITPTQGWALVATVSYEKVAIKTFHFPKPSYRCTHLPNCAVCNQLVPLGAPEAVRSLLILSQTSVFMTALSFLFDFSDTTCSRIAYDIIMEIHSLLLHNSLKNLMRASLCKCE